MKRIISFMLILALSLSIPLTGLAQSYDPYNTTILEDSEQFRIVETSDSDMIYRVTLDKSTNSIQMVVTNRNTSEIITGDTTYIEDIENELVLSTRASLKENTFVNYEYTKTYGTPNKWELRRPNNSVFSTTYFKTDETSSNSSDLSKYKGYVDSINTLEGQIIMGLGVSGLASLAAGAASAGAIFTGGVLTPAAWASIVALAGATTNYINTCMNLDRACKNAYDSYYTIYYKSSEYY